MTQGPAALGLARHRGQPPVSASPQRFSTQGYVKRAAVVGGGLMAAQDHVLAWSPGHRSPLRS